MAQKSIAVKHRTSSDKPLTKEEQTLVQMYRSLSRWDRNFLFMLLSPTSRIRPRL